MIDQIKVGDNLGIKVSWWLVKIIVVTSGLEVVLVAWISREWFFVGGLNNVIYVINMFTFKKI